MTASSVLELEAEPDIHPPPEANIAPIGEAAAQLAQLGYAVFPCHPDSKQPATAHGLLDASTDAETVERWWSENPGFNIGLATKGLLVVDIDGADNPWLSPERAAELTGPRQRTASGGTHIIYRQPAGANLRNTAGRLAERVDTRADGGYVVVAPSVVGGRPYEWLPDLALDCPASRLPEPPKWLLDQLTETTTVRSESPIADGNPIPSGQRNATLARLAGVMRRTGMREPAIRAALRSENAVRCSPPLETEEVDKIAWSVARYEPDQVTVAVMEDHWRQLTAPSDEELSPDRPNDPGPLPADLLDVGGLLGDVIRYNLKTAFVPQPVFALAGAIALTAVVISRKIADPVGTRPNIYVLSIGQSGSGKERAREVNKEILPRAGAGHLLGPEGFASHAGVISALEKEPATLFQVDEIGRFLQTLGQPKQSPHLFNIISVLMKLYSSSRSIYIGDAYADLKNVKRLVEPHACLYGTTVPTSLFLALSPDSLTDGFVSRLVIFEGDDDRERQTPAVSDVPAEIITEVKAWSEFRPGGNLSDSFSPQPFIVPYTDDAAQRLATFDDAVTKRMRGQDEATRGIWCRAVEKARKLALIFACSEFGPPIDTERKQLLRVTASAADWGCRVSEHLTSRLLLMAEDHVAANPDDALRKKALRLLRKYSGELKWSQFLKRMKVDKDVCLKIVRTLEATGDVKLTERQTGGRTGQVIQLRA